MKFVRSFFGLLVCVGSIVLLPVDDKMTKRDLEGRVINGRNAKLEDFPYNVLIRQYFPAENVLMGVCSGALISDQTILTAAHCFVHEESYEPYPIEDFDGVLGAISAIDYQRTLVFTALHKHEYFVEEFRCNDIAVVILAEKVNGINHPMALPSKGQSFDGTAVIALGWGSYTFGQEYGARLLRYTKTYVADSGRLCSERSSKFDQEDQICLEQKQNVCVMKGDSGSPLIIKNDIFDLSIGVLSWGFSNITCSRLPAVYMSTSAYHDWIEKYAVGDIIWVDYPQDTDNPYPKHDELKYK